MVNPLSEWLEEHPFLILDGATGTNLQRRGLPWKAPSDLWTLDRPDEVLRLHTEFLVAGAQILLTNTFGSSRLRLRQAGVEERFEAANRQAVALARRASEGFPNVWVAGTLGPLGERLEPWGGITFAQARAFYFEQAQILQQAGVDLLVIETQFDFREACAAVEACLLAGNVPVICSFSFNSEGRLISGESPLQAGRALEKSGVFAVGINCGSGVESNLQALAEMRAATSLPLWFKPNAGIPVLKEGQWIYPITPEQMAEVALRAVSTGAKFIGGCCGTTPQHIHAIVQELGKAKN